MITCKGDNILFVAANE